MGIRGFLEELLGKEKKKVEARDVMEYADSREITKLALKEFAITTAVEMIAGVISKCEFKTISKDKKTGETKEDELAEYYAWNVEPNKNQNANQFKHEIMSKILTKQECLVVEVKGQLIIADSYNLEEHEVSGNIYKDIRRKNETLVPLARSDEVLLYKLSDNNILRLLKSVSDDYTKIINNAVEDYIKAGGEKGVVDIEAIAKEEEDYEDVLDELMNEKFRAYFKAKNAVLTLEEGYSYTPQNNNGKSTRKSEGAADILKLADEVFSVVARGFNMSPALLKGDIADIKDVTTNFVTFSIAPYARMIQTENNRKRNKKAGYIKGNRFLVDITNVRQADVFGNADAIDKLIASSYGNIDEVRKKAGDTELNTPESKKRYITKNYQGVEGGEENGEKNTEPNKV